MGLFTESRFHVSLIINTSIKNIPGSKRMDYIRKPEAFFIAVLVIVSPSLKNENASRKERRRVFYVKWGDRSFLPP